MTIREESVSEHKNTRLTFSIFQVNNRAGFRWSSLIKEMLWDIADLNFDINLIKICQELYRWERDQYNFHEA